MKEIYGIIYSAKNIINNKIYIGQTKYTIEKRKAQHLVTVENNNYNYRSKFYNAIKKYGKENFIWSKIDEALTKDELNKKEIFYIKKFDSIKNGYNLTKGGNGGDLMRYFGKEEKEKIYKKAQKSFTKEKRKQWKKNISKANKNNIKLINSLTGRKLSKSHKDQIKKGIIEALKNPDKRQRICHKGEKRNPFTEEHKKRLSEAAKNKLKSDTHKRKISMSMKGKKRCKKCNKYFTKEEAIKHIELEGGEFTNFNY